MTEANELGTETIAQQVGALFKQRREERGLSRKNLAKEIDIELDETLINFEYGQLPAPDIQRKLEKALDWRLGIIEEVTRTTVRKYPLTMEELDAEDSYFLAGQHVTPSLASASDVDLLAEMARRGL